MNLPSISVITACLNSARFIENTIQSVLAQTYPHLEYIIIDGGSTDGTAEIISGYASRLAYWHSRPDRGLAHAFNLGLAWARGEWILFLNADDYFQDSEAVASMVPHLMAHEATNVVFGQVALISRDRSLGQPLVLGKPWRWQKFRFGCTIQHQAAFTRRRYFDRVGVFDENLRLAMDYEHYLRAGSNLAAVFVPQIVSVMRDGGLSLNNVIPSLIEWRQAQTTHGVASLPAIWANFLARALSFLLQIDVRKITAWKRRIQMPKMEEPG